LSTKEKQAIIPGFDWLKQKATLLSYGDLFIDGVPSVAKERMLVLYSSLVQHKLERYSGASNNHYSRTVHLTVERSNLIVE